MTYIQRIAFDGNLPVYRCAIGHKATSSVKIVFGEISGFQELSGDYCQVCWQLWLASNLAKAVVEEDEE